MNLPSRQIYPPIRVVVVLCAVLAALTAGSAMSASAAVTSPITTRIAEQAWGTNGRVSAILPVGDRVFVAGSFTAVTDPSGNTYPVSNLAVYLPSSGSFDTGWHPNPNGRVAALAIDGNRLYLGGDFTEVAGLPRTRLAAVNADSAALDTGWTPGANNTVNALKVSGGKVYVGGLFAQLTGPTGSVNFSYLGRLSAVDGAVDTSWTPRPDAQVRTLALSATGSQVYVGGEFASISAKPNTLHVASLDTATGAPTSGFAAGTTNGTARPAAYDMYVDGARLLVAVGGGGGGCASLDASSGQTQWSVKTNGNVQAVTAFGGAAYCGGHFDGTGAFGGLTRNKLAAVDEQSGAVLSFAPRINSVFGVWSLASGAGRVFAGGDFTKITNRAQPFFASFLPDGAQTAPSAPQNLVVRPGDSSARLFWDIPWTDGESPITSYRVYRILPDGSRAKVQSTATRSWTDTPLTNGSTYTYVVTAVNALGESPSTPPQTLSPSANSFLPPTRPQALSVSGTDGTAHLAWSVPQDDGQSPITSYLIKRANQQGAELTVASVDATQTTYQDTQVTPGNTYFYEVVAVNAVGQSAPSNEVSFVITSAKPSAPVLTATTSPGQVTLSWSEPASGSNPITKYTLLRDSIQYAQTKVPVQTYDDVNVVSGTTYVYRVRATSLSGNSPLSSPVTVKVP